MVAININEIEQNLKAYLRRVAAGEVIVVTEEDHPIAQIKPAAGSTPESPRLDPLDFMKGRIDDATLPSRWADEGASPPSEACRQSALHVASELFSKYGLLPSKVLASRVEGLYLEYKSPQTGRLLGIEVDNELDVVAVVSDADQVLASAVFEGEEADRLLAIFFGRLERAAGDSRPADA